MRIVSWNINSVRLRAPLVEQLIDTLAPDIICLQETKCPNDSFPHKAFAKKGFAHIAKNGIKGYHGVAVLSRQPFEAVEQIDFCGQADGRHLCVEVAHGGAPLAIHNFYVPAGGDIPDAKANEKFAHKLQFLDEMTQLFNKAPSDQRAILVGDLNIAPYEHDVWSSKQLQNVVSHTPIEREKLAKLRTALDWEDVARRFVSESEKLYSWWSYRARDWQASDRGRRLDHIWASQPMRAQVTQFDILKAARGWERPSDHAPVFIDIG